MKTLRHTLTTLSLGLGLLLTGAASLTLGGCQDDLFPGGPGGENAETGTRVNAENEGPLRQDPNTKLWEATERVPLVGVGRVADDISGNLLEIISFDNEGNSLDNVFDENLENYAVTKAAFGDVNLGAEEGLCVRDLYRTYKGGQKVGFVIEASDASVLSVEALQTIWIATSSDGVNWETMTTENPKVSVLDIELLSPKGSNVQAIQVTPKKEFNRIKFGFTGVNVGLLKGLKIYYAFVGETPITKIIKPEFKDATAEASVWHSTGKDQLVDSNPDNGPTLGPNFGGIWWKVNFGSQPQVPAGSEIGFYSTGGGIGIGLFTSTKLSLTYEGVAKEEEISLDGGVVGLSISGGSTSFSAISDKNKIVTAAKIQFDGLNADLLKWSTIHYAYYRKPVTIDPSAYFALPEHVETTSSSYQLPNPEKGSVTYELAGPAQVAINDKKQLYGMTVDGDYKVNATYTADDGKTWINYTMTITKTSEKTPECHVPITTAKYSGAKVVENREGEGWLLNIANAGLGIDEEHTADKLIDSNTNNYAGSVNLISLVGQDGIVAIDAGTLIGEEETQNGGKIRAGFVMQTSNQLLDLDALSFYNIRLLGENKEEVAGGNTVTDQNNTVGLGLLAGDGSKIRYSIESEKPFRYIELYVSGVANVNLSLLRIYYAFWEDATNSSCQDVANLYIPGDACTTQMTAANNNLSIWYEKTANQSLVSVQGQYSNLGNAIDDDRETMATIQVTNVAGSTTLGFQFDPIAAGQPIGVLLRNPTGVLNADLLKTKPEIECFYRGISTGDETGGSFGLVEANVLGFGGYLYLEVTPSKDKRYVDGLVVTFSEGLLTALSTFQVCGIYYRPTNEEGIPECSVNPDEGDDSEGINMDLETTNVCVGDPITIKATAGGVGTPTQETFFLRFYLDEETAPKIFEVSISDDGKLVTTDNQPLSLDTYGMYSVALYANQEAAEGDGDKISSSTLILTVHNTETKWTGVSRNHDWNTWGNWTQGTPSHCTNVIIPGGLGDNYPILSANETNVCANLYIEDGGQLVNSFYLDYDLAWVDVELDENRYYMLTSPLKATFSGDWFINSSISNLGAFVQLNSNSYPEQRTNPTVYQRLWSANAPVKNPSGYEAKHEVAPDETHWTPPYNGVAQEYGLGMGFSLMVKGGSNNNTFRFPKTHTEYNYFNLAGRPSGESDEITRGEGTIGRFIYEGENNTATDGTITVPVQKPEDGVTACLVGNPFVAHVYLASFMQKNGIGEVKVFDGNENNSLILVDGQLVSSGSSLTYIKPMESFFVMNYTGNEVTYTADMLTAGGETRTRSAAPAPAVLRLAATLDGHTAHALLRVSPTASAGVVPGEDTKLLVEGEARPAVAIYTVADGRALDIQQVPDDVRRIPLGFYLPGGGKADIRLTPQFTDPEWSDWFLLDLRTGQRRRLTPAAIDLHDVENGSSRYVLVKNEGE